MGVNFTAFNKQLTVDIVKEHIIKYDLLAKEIEDIFIVSKNDNVVFVSENVSQMLSFVTKGKNILKLSIWKQQDYLGFLADFITPSNKYRTYNKMRIWKYKRTLELGHKTDKLHFSEICKEPLVQVYFREKKLERILNETLL